MKRFFEKCREFAEFCITEPYIAFPILIVFILMSTYCACLVGLMLDNAIFGIENPLK